MSSTASFTLVNFSSTPEPFTVTVSSVFAENVTVSSDIALNLSTALAQDHNGASPGTKEVIQTVQHVLLPLFMVTGLVGNSLTVVTMMSRDFSQMTSRYILICLAVSDSVFLLTQPLNMDWVRKLFEQDVRALNDVSCKTFYIVYRSAKMTSSWLVVLLCFERFVAVVYPLKMKAILKKRVMFPAIAVNYVVMVTVSVAWSLSAHVKKGVCTPHDSSVQVKVSGLLGCIVYSVLPSLTLTVFTPIIISRLRQQIARRRALNSSATDNNKPSSRTSDDMIRASRMVLGVMIAYVILVIPITVVMASGALGYMKPGFSAFKEIARMMEQVNYAGNFYVYILCSTMFRQRVVGILKACLCVAGLRRSTGDTRSTGNTV